ncbi:MAG TPA: hypothetical protein VHW45_00655 [Candidatus Sulfotelmatobacter sp.]|jgi:hypothetical protein|nr:hypothetical protein [Candidatus Sulfotelmatobacter sp.]
MIRPPSPSPDPRARRQPNGADTRGQFVFHPDSQLREDLSTFWQHFRGDNALWLRGIADEQDGDYPFPARMVAYDLIPFFQQWAIRLSDSTPQKSEWATELIAAIYPDDEYIAWAESDDRSDKRERECKRFKGRLYRRSDRSRLYGVWEKEVQHGWVTAKNRAGKYQVCESCRGYDLQETVSPGTLALRQLCQTQPVQNELNRLIRSAVERPPRQAKDKIRRTNMSARRLVKRSAKYGAIDLALEKFAEALPQSHEEVFRHLEERGKRHPSAEPFGTARGWMAGFKKDPARARVWLSKRWALLRLPPFAAGPKSNY